MSRCSASTTRTASRWGCMSVEPRRGRAAGAAAGRCGQTASAGSSWWTSRRSARPVRLMWHKRRWRCPSRGCGAGTVTEQDPEIAPPREKLTARAGRWATRQAGRARPVDEVAAELGCSWHPANASVRRWGSALLDADTERISDVEALGLDETLMGRRGRFKDKAWSTSIVDVGRGQLLDIVPGRTAKAPALWLLSRPREWLEQIRWAVLDLSVAPIGPRSTPQYPTSAQVADPFHVVRSRETPRSTRSAAGSRTRPWATAAASPTPSTGPASCSSPRPRASPTPDASGCGACWRPATPTARSATPGTRRRPCAASTDIPDAERAPATARRRISRTPACRRRSTGWACTIWRWRTQICTPPGSPTEPPTPIQPRKRRARRVRVHQLR